MSGIRRSSSGDMAAEMSPPRAVPGSPVVVGPDNRCCFCLTLQKGSVLAGIVDLLSTALLLLGYLSLTGDRHQDPNRPPAGPSDLDVTVWLLCLVQALLDVALIYGAVNKLPVFTVPWLFSHVIIMVMVMSLLVLLLMFGYVQLSLNYGEYVGLLCFMGILAAIHLFSCVVVFQFRKNMLEERTLITTVATIEEAEPPQTYVRPSSPPPTYEEVSKGTAKTLPVSTAVASSSAAAGVGGFPEPEHEKYFQSESESPPEYASAVAAAAAAQAQVKERECLGAAASSAPSAPPQEPASSKDSPDATERDSLCNTEWGHASKGDEKNTTSWTTR